MMKPHKLTPKRQSESAFTIVELLIVVVIIAILAAITVVAYNGIQNRARASAASSALSQAVKKLELYKVDNSAYPTSTNLASAGITNANDTTYQYTSDGTTYCLTATNVTVSYYLNSTTTPSPTAGGCPGHGQGGVAAITNLATDPRATKYVSADGEIGWKRTRWAGCSPGAANYALVTSASDGPVGITTYIRKTWTVAPSDIACSGDTGFDLAATTLSRLIVTAGDSYTISCYLRPSVTRTLNVGVYQYTSAGVAFSPGRSYGPYVTGTANQWNRVSYAYTVPAGVAQISFVCDSSGNSDNGAVNWQAGASLDGTGLMVTKGSSLYNFADGNSPNWVWNGTANASTSTGPAP